MKHIFSICACVFVLVFSMSASAATYYIDPTYQGSPRDGSIDNPFNSWSEVPFASGDNSYLQKRGTTATATTAIVPKSNNTMGAYGTGALPIIDSTCESGQVINLSHVHDTTIEYLEIIAPDGIGTGIQVAGHGDTCYDNTIDHCVIHGPRYGMRVFAGGGETWSGMTITHTEVYNIGEDGIIVLIVDDVEVANCLIYDINQRWNTVGHTEAEAGGDCLQFAVCDNIYVHHNLLDHSSTGNKFALIANLGDGGIVEFNHLIGQTCGEYGGSTIYHYDQPNMIIRSNVIENGFHAIYTNAVFDGILIYNNIINSNDDGICLGAGYTAEVYNNTFYNTGSRCLYHGGVASGTAMLNARNNIFEISQGEDMMYYVGDFSTPGNFVSDYNLVDPVKEHFIRYNGYYDTLAAWQVATSRDLNSIADDPLFVDASAGDFRLDTGSPGIGSGTVIRGHRHDGI